MTLPVTKIQKFCTKDGPGVRTTVFLKGCPLRCLWCHNPETQSVRAEFFYVDRLCIGCTGCASVCPQNGHHLDEQAHTIDRSHCIRCMACAETCPAGALEACQKMMTADEIITEVLKDKPFYGLQGGLTLSGGEPTMHIREILPILKAIRDAGVTTAIETCGYFDADLLDDLVPLTDLFLWDLKDTDPIRHEQNVGGSLKKILANLRRADALGARTRLRCILLRGINLNEQHLQGIADVFGSLRHCEGVELLPYHTYGDSKNDQLGRPSAAHIEWIPTDEDMQQAAQYLSSRVTLI